MRSFFSPKSRLKVARPLALFMNTLNLLGPALLLTALILLGAAQFGDWPPTVRNLLTAYAASLIAVALAIRIGWGIGIRCIARRTPPPE